MTGAGTPIIVGVRQAKLTYIIAYPLKVLNIRRNYREKTN
jgi:hypothetical protein